MRVLKQSSVYLFFLLIFAGCSNDDDSYDRYWIDIATVENPQNSNEFFLRLDDNTLLWTEESNFPTYKPADGQRVIANYSIVSDKHATGLYDYDVKLNDVYEVLTKGIFEISPETQDSIGNDSIYVSDIWVGSNYLNVEFVYQGFSKTHFINLVSDTAKTYTDDGKVHLEFRHNANNDLGLYDRWGIVSFDISSLQQNHTDSVNLVIHVNEPDKVADKLYELTYYFDSGSSGIKKGTLRSSFLNGIQDVDIE